MVDCDEYALSVYAVRLLSYYGPNASTSKRARQGQKKVAGVPEGWNELISFSDLGIL